MAAAIAAVDRQISRFEYIVRTNRIDLKTDCFLHLIAERAEKEITALSSAMGSRVRVHLQYNSGDPSTKEQSKAIDNGADQHKTVEQNVVQPNKLTLQSYQIVRQRSDIACFFTVLSA